MQIMIVGCGEMGSALAEGLAKTPGADFLFHDAHPEKAEELAKKLGGKAVKNTSNISDEAVLLLACKPDNIDSAATFLKDLPACKFLGSVLAGVKTATLKKHFPRLTPVRLMPNLAVRYGEGVIAVAEDASLPTNDISTFLAPLGTVKWLPEKDIDAFTALAGSGPAFIYVIIEALVDAGIFMGLKQKDSTDIAAAMIKGSLTVLEKSGKSPSQLKTQVTSPGGTTIAGLRKMEEKNVRSALFETLIATYEKSKSMGKE